MKDLAEAFGRKHTYSIRNITYASLDDNITAY